MSMSKKDFIALAETVKGFDRWADQFDYEPFSEEQINALANFCEGQNPNFKRDRWRDYIAGKCGPNGGSSKG